MPFQQPQDEIDLINQAERDLENASSIIKENIDQEKFGLAWFNFYVDKHFRGIDSEENRTIFFNEILRFADLLVEDNSDSEDIFGDNSDEMLKIGEKYRKLFKDPTLLPDGKTFGVTIQGTVGSLKAKFMEFIN